MNQRVVRRRDAKRLVSYMLFALKKARSNFMEHVGADSLKEARRFARTLYGPAEYASSILQERVHERPIFADELLDELEAWANDDYPFRVHTFKEVLASFRAVWEAEVLLMAHLPTLDEPLPDFVDATGKALVDPEELGDYWWEDRPLYEEGNFFTFIASVWDVDAARELVKDREPNFTAKEDGLADLYGMVSRIEEGEEPGHATIIGFIGIDKKAALSDDTDMSQPLIAIPLFHQGEQYGNLLIDGWHQAYKAHLTGVPELHGHYLTQEEAERIRVC